MLLKIRTITKQKGQGIVEYALILAFVVGIGMMLNGANLGDALVVTFDKVAEVIDGSKKDYAWARKNLSGLSKDAIREKATEEERIKLDQEALANIGRVFIGLTKGQVEAILKCDYNNNFLVNDKGVWLANYHDKDADNADIFKTDFDYKNNNSQLEAKYQDISSFLNGSVAISEQGLTGSNTNLGVVESNSRSFFSDYMMGTNGDATDRSIRLNLHYTTENINGQNVQVVDGARVRINVGSTTNGGSLMSYSADHDVIVNKDKKYEKTFKNDTGLISVDTSNTKNKGNSAWYNDLNF